jgi:hypothetical protein
VAIKYRWANNQQFRLEPLAAELVRRQVAVIVVLDPRSIFAAKSATSTIPIVFGAPTPNKMGARESGPARVAENHTPTPNTQPCVQFPT